MIKIVPSTPGGPDLDVVLQDYRQRYALSEAMVLSSLLEALSTRRAQALLALEAGRPVGAIVLGQQGKEGRIYLLHVLPEATAAEPALLARGEEELARGEGVTLISATLATLPGGTLEETFRRRGYRVISRARMQRELASFEREVALPAGYRLVPWQAQRLEEAAALVAEAHRGEDVTLYPEVGSAGGARRLLEKTLAGELGTFDPALSPMALTGDFLAGLCLAVWHTALAGQGFVLDLCVDPAHRRQGLGRALVVATARGFREAGAQVLGLAVTWSNRPARQLYEGLGLRVEQRFGVFRREV